MDQRCALRDKVSNSSVLQERGAPIRNTGRSRRRGMRIRRWCDAGILPRSGAARRRAAWACVLHWRMTSTPDGQPFARLSPDEVLAAAERLGIDCDGRLFALNSYENRVYQLGSSSHGMLVLKFYRPGRWSDAQILEEHTFTLEMGFRVDALGAVMLALVTTIALLVMVYSDGYMAHDKG
ncbi:MAG: hypothetical protein EBS39_10990, partial [Gammaproteobacteria bacterium]|nr:hypothetical protein [Gammaproteobacteria bacterium]